MSTQNDGGPAFPCDQNAVEGTVGMTLRDWFAGMAMQGLLAADVRYESEASAIAMMAYEQADAMLDERQQN